MRITVFGAGYVGLVTGAGLADLGHDVLIVDINTERITQLQSGGIPIHEPGLPELVRRNTRGGRLAFATTVAAPFDAADAYFVAVGTPPLPDGSADTRAVLAVGAQVATKAQQKALLVVKSTVPVGTCDTLQVAASASRVPLEVVSNPEFLKEGSALADFFRPDRIVLGTQSAEALATMKALYAPLQLSGECVIASDLRSSELTKYAANTMLAMRISFMNELSRLCHAARADIHTVRLGIGSDARIGRKFLYAGPGYGGSCFPKDVQALLHMGRQYGVPMGLARATHVANEDQAGFLANLILGVTGGENGLEGKTIALWGLAFKPETDDVRDAPAVKLAAWLLKSGANVVGHDPEACVNFSRVLPRARVVDRDYDALDGADALVLLTEWRSYLAPDFNEIRRRLRTPMVIDARNVWRSSDVMRAGLNYQGVGTK